MPICEVTDSRKQFRDQQTTRRKRLVENLDTTLVREDTHSRDLVVYAYETETVIVTKRLWCGDRTARTLFDKRTIKLDKVFYRGNFEII